MDGTIQEGKTVREAIQRGLATLGMPEEHVDVVVLDEGSRGFLGLLGRRPARVKIIPGMGEERIRKLVERLLALMGFGAQVDVTVNQNRILVSVETAGMDGLLIGRHGQTLDAIQHVIDRMVNRGRRERCRVLVDIGAYRKRRRGTGQGKAGSRTRRGGEPEGDAVGRAGPEENLVHSPTGHDTQSPD